jgi:hypothetical protein
VERLGGNRASNRSDTKGLVPKSKMSLLVDIPSSRSIPRLRHNNIVPEFPCSGEVIELEKFSTEQIRVAICTGCGTEFQYLPDSTWVKIILPGMRNPI